MKIQFSWGYLRAIVYITVLLIIFEIVRPKFGRGPSPAGQTSARAQISMFKRALELYRIDVGAYPSSLDALMTNSADKNYLNDLLTIPTDPWGNPYRYSYPGVNGHEFEIISLGADGEPGGKGDSADIVSWDLFPPHTIVTVPAESYV